MRIRLKSFPVFLVMLRVGLDIGTGFVKCVSDHGSIRFPSVYVKRIHGHWTEKSTEAVGDRAKSMLSTTGAMTISPICRGRPDPRYQKQAELLLKESMEQIYKLAKTPAKPDEKIRIVVGLPYHAFGYRDSMTRLVRKTPNVDRCTVVSQASGTLVDLGQKSAITVSIGQGTTEIVVIDDLEVIDGESSRWASDFVTKKIDKFAHLDMEMLNQNRDVCKKYSKVMAENLTREICDMSENYGNQYPIVVSGGGLLLPGMHGELIPRLEKFKIFMPDDPVMSNAKGLYKLAGYAVS